MKKVLIIGHFWPYRRGGNRIIGLSRYLRNFGWEPIIITGNLYKKPDEDVKYFEVSYKYFLHFLFRILKFDMGKDMGNQFREVGAKTSSVKRSILRFFYTIAQEIFAFPDEDRNFKTPALLKAREVLKNEKISAIISEYPVTSHLVASSLKKEFNIPWIADFVDPWSQNHDYPYGLIRRFFDRNLEVKTMKGANALTTVSKVLADNLKKLHKKDNTYAIPNGFDSKNLNIPAAPLTKNFTITYTGQMYVGKRDPDFFLLAVRGLVLDGELKKEDTEIRFYGPMNPWLEEKIKAYNLSHIVTQYGSLSREDSMNKQKESQVLLLCNWKGSRGEGVYTGKIFEYLTSMRPILATEGALKNNVVKQVLKETKAGVSGDDVSAIKELILKYYREYQENGSVKYNGIKEEIEKYSYNEMAKQFSKILNEITK